MIYRKHAVVPGVFHPLSEILVHRTCGNMVVSHPTTKGYYICKFCKSLLMINSCEWVTQQPDGSSV